MEAYLERWTKWDKLIREEWSSAFQANQEFRPETKALPAFQCRTNYLCHIQWTGKASVYLRLHADPVDLVKHALDCSASLTELSTGGMDTRVGSDRVGSGHDFAGFWRVGSALRFFLVFYWLFLGTWINLNLRKLGIHSDWCSTIFNV